MVYFWIMIRKFRNRGFIIPMVASIILLPCFVAYFLRSEFEKEKEAMVLEERDNAFSDFFSQIDTLTNSSLFPHTGGLISWMKDSSGSDVSYKLRIESDSISDFGSAFKIRGMHALEFEQGN